MYEKKIVRPTVTVSYAQTLDRRLATASGSSQWISRTRQGLERLFSDRELTWQSFGKVIGVTAGDLHFPSF